VAVTDGLGAARVGALSGKVAILTGGASGIGHAVMCRFLEAGARVVIADVDEERGK
jgi:NAD(P)-dependent dehydrogenase (short-subunit alcohol dehydrogenase family)